jgi:TIR domain/Bacterial PH domain
VFVCHSHEDKKYVRMLADHLVFSGIPVFVDNQIDFGSEWERELSEQLKDCAAVVVVMSRASGGSKWVTRELVMAEELGKPIQPLLLEEGTDIIPLRLRDKLYYNVVGGLIPDEGFVESLREHVARYQSQQRPVEVPRPRGPSAGDSTTTSTTPVVVLSPAVPDDWDEDLFPGRWAFPAELLPAGETVQVHGRLDWRRRVVPAVVVTVMFELLVIGVSFVPGAQRALWALFAAGIAAAVLCLLRAAPTLPLWLSTHFVLTNDRIIVRRGLFETSVEAVPYGDVKRLAIAQDSLDEFFLAGDLLVELVTGQTLRMVGVRAVHALRDRANDLLLARAGVDQDE